MELKTLAGAIALCLVPALVHAVERVDFDLKTTQDLLDVCTVDGSDSLASEAAYLCVGYFVGAIHYHNSAVGPNMKPLVCAPKGTTRNEVIHTFVAWGQANAGNMKLMGEVPVVGAVRAAEEKWPCKR
jgi:hypothetical protein